MADDLDRLLAEKYTNELRPGYQSYGDIFMLTNFPEYKDRLKNFEVRDDDVWVASYSKAGTTWTQEMVWLIANDLDYEGAKVLLNDRFPFLELNTVLDFNGYKKKHPDFECNESILDPIKHLDNIKGRRFIKTHLPWNYLPLQIQNQTKNAKIIHVMRNPKDACVSYYYHTRRLEGSGIELEDFVKLYIAGKVCYGSFFNVVLGYWSRRHLPNLLVIRYEDMKSDLPSVIRQVAEFLGKKIADDQMEKLTKHLSFEVMKTNRAVNFEPLLGFTRRCITNFPDRDTAIFMRAGQAGNYKKELTPEMIKIMDEWIEENTAGTDLKFNI